jgi:hypothetical protein
VQTVQGEHRPLQEPVAVCPGPTAVDFKDRVPETGSPSLKEAVSSRRKLAAELDRNLDLSPLQKGRVEEILREREAEIKAFHEAIRNSGFVDLRHYDWQAGLMKDRWYRRVDALLDGVQHERFVAQVRKGILNEGLEFTVEPGITVLD